MRKNDKRSHRFQRFLAGFLAAVMVLGLVMGSGVSVPVRAAESETTEQAAPAEKVEQEAKAEVSKEEAAAEEKAEVSEESGSDESDEAAESKDEAKEADEAEQKEETAETADEEEKDADSEETAEASDEEKVDADSEETTETSDEEETDAKDSDLDLKEDTVPAEAEKPEQGAVGNKSENPAFADMSPEEQYKALLTMSEKEQEEAVNSLSEEQVKALSDYIVNLSIPDSKAPKTVVFTQAGPFKDPVPVSRAKGKKLFSAPKAPAKEPIAPPDGLEMSKHATLNPDGTYTIELETYTTGEVTSEEISLPVDIVLVLDQSGSMAYSFDDQEDVPYAQSRQKAMKDAVQNFIGSVAEEYTDKADHRISIVTFGSNASDLVGWTYADEAGESSLSSLVSGLPQRPSGATNVAAGMGRAQHLVTDEYNYTGDNTANRQKVVIVFTDGVPTTQTAFSTQVATGAINAANNIKNAGATVYTVGIFTGVNPSQTYGNTGFDENSSNGNVGTHWAERSILWWGDIAQYDIPAGNRFLNYMSSNYEDATEIGLKNYSRTDWLLFVPVTYTGWEITKNFTRTNNGYFLSADNADSLDDVFQSIAQQISTPTISLGTDTVIKDIISPQFQLPENSTVKFYTQAYNGNNWGTKTQITDGSVHLVETGDDKNVSATGFDFDANCVTEQAKEDGTHGKKLIIEITVEPDPDFLGGNVSTNGEDSGVVSDGETIANFTVEPVDVPLKKLEADLTDKNIYLSTEDKLADIFNKDDQTFTISSADGNNPHTAVFSDIFDGDNNAAVDVTFEIYDGNTLIESFTIPHGETSGDWASDEPPVLTADSYTIKCVITDAKDSTNKTTGEETANINVFKPSITYEDKNVYYKGTQIPVSSIAPTKTEWKHGDTLDTAVTMDTTKPNLTYEYGGITEGTVDQTTDYTVSVTKVISDAQENYDLLVKAPNEVTFLRDCTKENLDDAEASASEAFKIHVYTPSYDFVDMAKYYGEAITLPSSYTATWKDADGNAAPSTMNNSAPTITVTTTPAENAIQNGYVWATQDFDVAVEIKAGDTDITSDVIGRCTRTCDSETGLTPTAGRAYVVHVGKIKTVVSKSILGSMANLTKKFTFTVSFIPNGNGAPTYTAPDFELGNNETHELENMPLGTLTLTETGVPDGYKVSFTVGGTAGSEITPSGGTAQTSINLFEKKNEEDIVEVVVTNKLEEIPLTGINIPVIYLELLIVCGAAIGFALIALRARKKREIRNS